MPTVRPAMISPASQPTSTECTLMSGEAMHEGRVLTVAGNPAKDWEESNNIIDGLLGSLKRNDGTMDAWNLQSPWDP